MTAPAKRAVSRLTLRLVALSRSSVPLTRVGSEYGGWWVPTSLLFPGAQCLCVGAGEDISFDTELAETYGANVATIDPTPRAIAHVRANWPSGEFQFHALGAAGDSGTRRFFAPTNPRHVSHSILNLQQTTTYFDAECHTIAQLQRITGFNRLDLLKLDIEGAEHEVVENLLSTANRPSVICVEFDQPMPNRRIVSTVRALRSAGYRPLRTERFNVTFTWAGTLAEHV